MRPLFSSTMALMKVGTWAWDTGWGVWSLWVTWSLFFSGEFWIPFTQGGIIVGHGDWLGGLLMLAIGVPLVMTIVHFVSTLLIIPGSLLCSWIANQPGNEDLAARLR